LQQKTIKLEDINSMALCAVQRSFYNKIDYIVNSHQLERKSFMENSDNISGEKRKDEHIKLALKPSSIYPISL
jgi:hypothetical protein